MTVSFQVTAPHFTAGCHDNECAPIIKYMENWPIERVPKNWSLHEYPVSFYRKQNPDEISITTQGVNEFKMSGTNDYSNIFSGIAKSKNMGSGYAPRLEIGQHRLALKSYRVKDSTKGGGKFIEAEFVVLQSTKHNQGETRGWAWFINATGPFAPAYEQDRAKKFLEAVGASIGDNSSVEVIGAQLAGPEQLGRGLIIEVDIMAQGGKNAGKTNSKGEPYTNSFWKPVKQTLEDLAASRAELDAMTPVATTEDAAPKGLGLLGRK